MLKMFAAPVMVSPREKGEHYPMSDTLHKEPKRIATSSQPKPAHSSTEGVEKSVDKFVNDARSGRSVGVVFGVGQKLVSRLEKLVSILSN